MKRVYTPEGSILHGSVPERHLKLQTQAPQEQQRAQCHAIQGGNMPWLAQTCRVPTQANIGDMLIHRPKNLVRKIASTVQGHPNPDRWRTLPDSSTPYSSQAVNYSTNVLPGSVKLAELAQPDCSVPVEHSAAPSAFRQPTPIQFVSPGGVTPRSHSFMVTPGTMPTGPMRLVHQSQFNKYSGELIYCFEDPTDGTQNLVD